MKKPRSRRHPSPRTAPKATRRAYTRQLLVPIYHVHFLLSVSDDAVGERRKDADRFGPIDDGEYFLAMVSGNAAGGVGAWFQRDKVNAGVIAHEAFHLAVRVLAGVDVALVRESEECYAHLVQWFADEIDLAVVKAGR